MTSARRQVRAGMRQAGLTLVELMVVVAIIGFLMISATVMISRDPTAEDVAQQLASVIGEASRKAVAGGAVAPEHVETYGQWRTQVRLFWESGYRIASIERLNEADGTMPVLTRRVLSRAVEIAGFRRSAELEPGSVPAETLPAGSELLIKCYPSGECLPDGAGTAVTLYLRDVTRPTMEARVVVLPLRGVPLVFGSW